MDFLQEIRIESRSIEHRKRLRNDPKVINILYDSFANSKDIDLLILAISIFANLVVGNDEKVVLNEFIDNGLVALFHNVCVWSVASEDRSKLCMICTIALGNVLLQIEDASTADSIADTQIIETCLVMVTDSCLPNIKSRAHENLSVLITSSKYSSSLNRRIVAAALERFRQLLQIGTIGLFDEILESCTNEPEHITCITSLIEGLTTEGETSHVFWNAVTDRSIPEKAISCISILHKLISFFETHQLGAKCINRETENHLMSLITIASSELSIDLGVKIGTILRISVERLGMEPSTHTLANCCHVLESHNSEIVKLAEEIPTCQSSEVQSTIYDQILPYASIRLGVLSFLNSMSARQDQKSVILSEGSCQMLVHICLAVAQHDMDLDIEGTRYAVNIIRNLCLEPEIRECVILEQSCFEVGGILCNLCITSRDANASACAAAVLRIVTAGRSVKLLHSFLNFDQLAILLRVDVAKITPITRVEIARMFTHVICTMDDSLETLRALVVSAECLQVIGFLLLSEHEMLHQEVFEALRLFPSAICVTNPLLGDDSTGVTVKDRITILANRGSVEAKEILAKQF